MTNTNFDKLVRKLNELFMLEHEDLDFGIYRIMNFRRREIKDFIQNGLLAQVAEELNKTGNVNRNQKQAELDKIKKQLIDLGVDPETNPKVKALTDELAQSGNAEAMENEVFSRLYDFFSRYYQDGDFVSLRRYKANVYAVPYEGEEVKLHWANADQYYIKSSEYFKNYRFTLSNGKKIEFSLRDASTEQNNNKSVGNTERRFRLVETDPLSIEGDILQIFFNYEPVEKTTKQDVLMADAFNRLKTLLSATEFKGVFAPSPTPKNKDRSLLEKHLTDYTARNSFDYFIHKDLGKFLNRELDFFIKNEVLLIDDIAEQADAVANMTRQFAKIVAIKKIARKIITFVASLEDFQRSLWLKKKWVTEAHYCLTLDRVPQKFYAEIAEKAAIPSLMRNGKLVSQLDEWIELYKIDKITGDTEGVQKDAFKADTLPFALPLSVAFLEQNKNLVLDTAFFEADFKYRLLAELTDLDKNTEGVHKNTDGLDQMTDGLLIHSDNFQALSFLQNRYKEQVKCVYIDPPYNTGGDDFIYKDDFQHSSWLAMLENRLEMCKGFISQDGTFAMSIDLKELQNALNLLNNTFGEENRKANISVKRGSMTGAKVINPGVVNITENILLYSINTDLWKPEKAYREKEYDKRYGSFILDYEKGISNWRFTTVLDAFAFEKKIEKSKLKKVLNETFESELSDFVISNAEKVFQLASLDEDNVSKEAVVLKNESLKSNKIHLLTRDGKNDYHIVNGKLMLFLKERLIRIGDRLVQGEPLGDIWDDVLPNDLHNEGGVALRKGKKPEKLIQRVVEIGSKTDEIILDFFVGSGTTCSVGLKTKRKWIGVEQGEYFDSITLKRVKNTLFGDKSGISKDTNWKGGGIMKYLRLESYEDVLNNLALHTRTAGQELALSGNADFQESYYLNYLFGNESRADIADTEGLLRNPFDVRTQLLRQNEAREAVLDVVETFNYLLGLVVTSTYRADGFHVVLGNTLPDTQGRTENVLIVWRNCTTKSAEDLNRFFERQGFNVRDREFDAIYVNGDHTLPNVLLDTEGAKVRLIESVLRRLMFEDKN